MEICYLRTCFFVFKIRIQIILSSLYSYEQKSSGSAKMYEW